MPFGAGFENLADSLGVASTPTQVADAITSAISRLGGGAGLGGTLYVPAIGSAPLLIDVSTQSLKIPSNVELRVAPGARIVPVLPRSGGTPRTDRVLEVEGAFRAHLGPVFVTSAGFAALSPADAVMYTVGAVRFTGRTIERVHPEWWGAGQGGDDSDALDAAVRSALLDRWTVTTSGERRALRPLVIELRGSYGLSRTLALSGSGRVAEASSGVELRAAAGAIEVPTFWCLDRFAFDQPMVTMRGFDGATFDQVRFDGRDRAGACLQMWLPESNDAMTATVLHRCEFQGATSELVRIEVEAIAATGTTMALSRQEVRLDGCRFMPQSKGALRPTALRLIGTPSTDVDVRGSLFEGTATAMIHASSCALSVESSQFQNTLMPRRGGEVPDFDDLHPNGPEGGVDIFLDAPVLDPSAARPEFGSPAMLHTQDCRSSSVQFLATCREAAPDSSRDITLVSLHHVASSSPGITLLIGRRAPPIPDVIPPDPVIFTPQVSTDKFQTQQEPKSQTPIEILVTPPNKDSSARDLSLAMTTSIATISEPLVGIVTQAKTVEPTTKTVEPTMKTVEPTMKTAEPTTKITGPSKLIFPATVFDVLLPVQVNQSTLNPPTLPEGATLLDQTINVGAPPMPSVIDWRLPNPSGARLVLIGCRFDWNAPFGRAAIRGYGDTTIADIGAFCGRALLFETPGTLLNVPTLAELDLADG